MIVAKIMEDGAETPRSAATFISEILPMMGTVTEPEQYSASNGLGVEIKQSSDSLVLVVLRLFYEGYKL